MLRSPKFHYALVALSLIVAGCNDQKAGDESDTEVVGTQAVPLTLEMAFNRSAWLEEGRQIIGDFNTPQQSVIDALKESLSGPPDETVTLDGGLTRISGCRLHSCDEKGALIVAPSGMVVAAGFIHFSCSNASADAAGRQCSATPKVTILVPSGETLGIGALDQWAVSKYTHIQREVIEIRPR